MKDPQEVFQKDLQQALFTWIILIGLCFFGIPAARAYPREAVESLLIPSLVMGPIGAFIVAACSSTMISAELIPDPKQKQVRILIAQIFSLVGFFCLIFPLLVSARAFYDAIRTTDWDQLFPDPHSDPNNN